MNKKGAQNAMLYVVIILVVGFLLYQGGLFAPAEEEEDGIPSEALPSDLQSTITMKFKDELATTETAVSSALWYAFASDGSYFNSGTASSGSASFTGNVQETYSVWAYTTGESGYIAKLTKISTGNKPRVAQTISLIKRSGFTMSACDDPIDLNTNISGTAGATEEIRAKWKLNVSNAGSLAPVLVIDTNTTANGVEDVTITKTDSAGGKWEEITCPDRLAPDNVKNRLYCFKRDKMALSTDGTIITSIVLKFDASTNPGDSSYAQIIIADTSMYLEPGYTTIDGIKFGVEDESNTDIGVAGETAVDRTTSQCHFSG